MNTQKRIIELAAQAHRKIWSAGTDVSAQTKKSHQTCLLWQKLVAAEFGDRFRREHPITKNGKNQKIDLVDATLRVGYELKASKNNVHMEIYRDVFKALVFNHRNETKALKALVFIAPKEGINKLGEEFPRDVQAIAESLHLKLTLEGI